MPHSAPMFLHNNTHLDLSDDETYYGLITDLLRTYYGSTHPEHFPNASRTLPIGVPKPRAEPNFPQNIIFYSHFWIFLIFALTLSVISNNNRQEIQQYDKKEKGITHTRKHHHHRLCSRRKMCCKGQRYGCLRALGCSRRCSGFTGQKKET